MELNITISAVLQAIALAASIFAVYFSYRIYRYNRLSKAWLSVTAALVFLSLRRFLGLLNLTGITSDLPEIIDFIDRPLVPLVVSLLLAIGLWRMKKSFETFDVVEKTVHEKISTFQKPRKK